MTSPALDEVVRRLTSALRRTVPVDEISEVVFGPGERHLANLQAQRRAAERRGVIVQHAGGPGAGSRGAVSQGGAPLRRAAVLIPLIDRADGATVLLTRRTSHLAVHAGQISLPGGRLEPYDADARAAALRETEEEIGVPRARVEVIGELEEYGTITGFRVTPVIGILRPPFTLLPDPTEVAEVFEVPLAFLLDPANCRHGCETRDGIERDIYEFTFGEYRIWGFTARILVRLAEAIRDAALGEETGAAGEKG